MAEWPAGGMLRTECVKCVSAELLQAILAQGAVGK